jgi:hypothetical protein
MADKNTPGDEPPAEKPNVADFSDVRCYYPPDFDNVANVARIDFTGTHIGFVPPGRPHWTINSQIPIRLRALRKIAEETKNHDLERDLYIEERKAERGIYLVRLLSGKERKNEWWMPISTMQRRDLALYAYIFWVGLMGLYWALSDYGRSFLRPLVWLIASGFFTGVTV